MPYTTNAEFIEPKGICSCFQTLYGSEREGENDKMPYCPECGGEMHYTPATKRYACKSCGLSLTHQELIELREQLRPKTESQSEQHQRERREYLKWWLSNKKK